MAKKYVYSFGGGRADGNESMKELLGGKGANLAEMAGHPDLRLPVPPGFTITTDTCIEYYRNGKRWPEGLEEEVRQHLRRLEEVMGARFGDPETQVVLPRLKTDLLEVLLAAGLRPLSVAILNIDGMAEIKRRRGRRAAGALLARLARLLESRLRSTDCVARSGSSRFTIALPEAGMIAVAGVTQRLRTLLTEALQRESLAEVASVSVGAASTETVGAEADLLLVAAERARRYAHRHGRNRVAIYRSPLVVPLLLPRPAVEAHPNSPVADEASLLFGPLLAHSRRVGDARTLPPEERTG